MEKTSALEDFFFSQMSRRGKKNPEIRSLNPPEKGRRLFGVQNEMRAIFNYSVRVWRDGDGPQKRL